MSSWDCEACMCACPAPSTQCMIDRGMTCRCDYNKAHRAVPNLQPRDREIFQRPTVFPVPSRFPAVRSVTTLAIRWAPALGPRPTSNSAAQSPSIRRFPEIGVLKVM